MPTGIVAAISSHPRRASTSSARISRITSERHSPLTILAQSLMNSPSSTRAVPRWVATRKVRKNLSFWWMFQPATPGRMTPWPRLEIGNGSAMPCVIPRITAWK